MDWVGQSVGTQCIFRPRDKYHLTCQRTYDIVLLMKANKLPDVHYLNECFTISNESPSGILWNKRPREHFRTERGWRMFNTRDSGTMAGHLTKSGDGCRFYLVKANQIKYPVHRVIFAIANGFDPADKEVDHIDGNGMNNNPENLRVATRMQNACNKSLQSNNRSGHTGITWCKRTKLWMAQIGHKGVTMFLGRYKNIEDAVKIRREKALELHGEYAGFLNRSQATR